MSDLMSSFLGSLSLESRAHILAILEWVVRLQNFNNNLFVAWNLEEQKSILEEKEIFLNKIGHHEKNLKNLLMFCQRYTSVLEEQTTEEGLLSVLEEIKEGFLIENPDFSFHSLITAIEKYTSENPDSCPAILKSCLVENTDISPANKSCLLENQNTAIDVFVMDQPMLHSLVHSFFPQDKARYETFMGWLQRLKNFDKREKDAWRKHDNFVQRNKELCSIHEEKTIFLNEIVVNEIDLRNFLKFYFNPGQIRDDFSLKEMHENIYCGKKTDFVDYLVKYIDKYNHTHPAS